MSLKKHLFIFFLSICLSTIVLSRSIHREPNPTIPYITVKSSNTQYEQLAGKKKSKKTKTNKFQSKFLRLKTLKKPFKNSNFKKYMLPNGNIKFRKGDQSVNSAILKAHNEHVLQEILKGHKQFTHFTVIADEAFNYNNISGFIVLKNKQYPFVLKLFIEHPHTFVDPLNKGIKASLLFVFNGNMRHLSGFTRIHNLHVAKKALSKDPEYRYYIDFPRKWFWLPQSKPFLIIDWHDQYYKHHETIKIPAIYGIVCDFIEIDKKIQQKEIHTLRQISVDIGNYLHNIIDSNVDNFVPEKNSNKIVIVDTEHFPTMIGLEKEMNANGYIQWYIELAAKHLRTTLLRPKQQRIKDQLIV